MRDGQPKILSSDWWTSRSGVMTAIGTFVAILGLVFSIFTGLRTPNASSSSNTTGNPGVHDTTPAHTTLSRTPTLGFEFYQNSTLANISFPNNNPDGADRVIVTLAKAPFEMRFPSRYARPGVRICAWTDDSIFDLVQGQSFVDHHCLGEGRGMADSQFGSGTLRLAKEAFNYFDTTRIATESADQSKIDFAYWAGTAPNARSGNLYLVLYVDLNNDKKFDNGDYEYVVLSY
jgi:hypothetical protein